MRVYESLRELASRVFLRVLSLTPLEVLPKLSALTIFAVVHTMIVEQDEEDSEAVRIIKKDIPAEYGVLIQKFRLIDDTFFNVCFDNYTEGMQLLLRIFFDRDDLVVRRVVTQQSADNLYGRGVRFDVLAEDSEGKLYDCEVQRANEGAIPRRARYNSSMMDSRELARGAEFSALPETWVIFITENDIYGAGFPLYHVERIIEELQRPFDDGAHILYVNGSNREDTPLGRLMQDFFCERPEQMNYKELAQRVDYFKAEAEGVNAMCELMEKFGEKKMEEARTHRKRTVTKSPLGKFTRFLSRIYLLVTLVFIALLCYSQFLTTKILIIIAAVLFVAFILIFPALHSYRFKKSRKLICILLAIQFYIPTFTLSRYKDK